MQYFEENIAPETLLLGVHWKFPYMPFYIINGIENEFLKLMEKYDYQVGYAVENLDDSFSDDYGFIVMNVASKDFVCGPVYES